MEKEVNAESAHINSVGHSNFWHANTHVTILSARAKTLLRHPLARTIIFQAVLRLIRIFILRR